MEGSMVKLLIAESEKKTTGMAEIPKSKTSPNQKDGKYYLVRLEMEREKLKSLIDEYDRDLGLAPITEDARGKIRNAVGKANLLATKRFKQFSELCHDNIDQDPEKRETKASDLQGYWEMMNIQVDDVKSLFKDLQTLKENGWKDIEAKDKADGRKPSTPRSKRQSPNGKSPKSKIDEEKVKREARNRLVAARKQAKLRQQQLKEEQEKQDQKQELDQKSSEHKTQEHKFTASLNSSVNSSFEIIDNPSESNSVADSCNGDTNAVSSCNGDTKQETLCSDDTKENTKENGCHNNSNCEKNNDLPDKNGRDTSDYLQII